METFFSSMILIFVLLMVFLLVLILGVAIKSLLFDYVFSLFPKKEKECKRCALRDNFYLKRSQDTRPEPEAPDLNM